MSHARKYHLLFLFIGVLGALLYQLGFFAWPVNQVQNQLSSVNQAVGHWQDTLLVWRDLQDLSLQLEKLSEYQAENLHLQAKVDRLLHENQVLREQKQIVDTTNPIYEAKVLRYKVFPQKQAILWVDKTSNFHEGDWVVWGQYFWGKVSERQGNIVKADLLSNLEKITVSVGEGDVKGELASNDGLVVQQVENFEGVKQNDVVQLANPTCPVLDNYIFGKVKELKGWESSPTKEVVLHNPVVEENLDTVFIIATHE